uniref:HMA domain-containing protein n=1 Tax=Oryza rufipogon TaxID=4529 RepID=A0A0E0QZM0_ORYRU
MGARFYKDLPVNGRDYDETIHTTCAAAGRRWPPPSVSSVKEKLDDAAAENAAVAGGAGGSGNGASTSESSPAVAVLQIDMDCWGHSKMVRKLVMDYPGVDKVTVDIPARRVMVAGKFDVQCLELLLQVRSKKKVNIISAPALAIAGR